LTDAAFDSFIIGDFQVFANGIFSTVNIQFLLEGVFMYPALLICFKLGGGLEIGL